MHVHTFNRYMFVASVPESVAPPCDRLNLVVRPNVLSGGSSYTFRLSAADTVALTTGKLGL